MINISVNDTYEINPAKTQYRSGIFDNNGVLECKFCPEVKLSVQEMENHGFGQQHAAAHMLSFEACKDTKNCRLVCPVCDSVIPGRNCHSRWYCNDKDLISHIHEYHHQELKGELSETFRDGAGLMTTFKGFTVGMGPMTFKKMDKSVSVIICSCEFTTHLMAHEHVSHFRKRLQVHVLTHLLAIVKKSVDENFTQISWLIVALCHYWDIKIPSDQFRIKIPKTSKPNVGSFLSKFLVKLFGVQATLVFRILESLETVLDTSPCEFLVNEVRRDNRCIFGYKGISNYLERLDFSFQTEATQVEKSARKRKKAPTYEMVVGGGGVHIGQTSATTMKKSMKRMNLEMATEDRRNDITVPVKKNQKIAISFGENAETLREIVYDEEDYEPSSSSQTLQECLENMVQGFTDDNEVVEVTDDNSADGEYEEELKPARKQNSNFHVDISSGEQLNLMDLLVKNENKPSTSFAHLDTEDDSESIFDEQDGVLSLSDMNPRRRTDSELAIEISEESEMREVKQELLTPDAICHVEVRNGEPLDVSALLGNNNSLAAWALPVMEQEDDDDDDLPSTDIRSCLRSPKTSAASTIRCGRYECLHERLKGDSPLQLIFHVVAHIKHDFKRLASYPDRYVKCSCGLKFYTPASYFFHCVCVHVYPSPEEVVGLDKEIHELAESIFLSEYKTCYGEHPHGYSEKFGLSILGAWLCVIGKLEDLIQERISLWSIDMYHENHQFARNWSQQCEKWRFGHDVKLEVPTPSGQVYIGSPFLSEHPPPILNMERVDSQYENSLLDKSWKFLRGIAIEVLTKKANFDILKGLRRSKNTVMTKRYYRLLASIIEKLHFDATTTVTEMETAAKSIDQVMLNGKTGNQRNDTEETFAEFTEATSNTVTPSKTSEPDNSHLLVLRKEPSTSVEKAAGKDETQLQLGNFQERRKRMIATQQIKFDGKRRKRKTKQKGSGEVSHMINQFLSETDTFGQSPSHDEDNEDEEDDNFIDFDKVNRNGKRPTIADLFG